MRTLKKDLWPCKVKVNEGNTKNITEVELWLGESFGTFRGRWNVVYQYNYTEFYFKNQRDANWFALRWA